MMGPNFLRALLTASIALMPLAGSQGGPKSPTPRPIRDAEYRGLQHRGPAVDVRHNARLFLRGHTTGAGNFTGSGVLVFDGSYSPGNSPAIVTIQPQVLFTATNVLTMEIGGLTPGPGTPTNNGYDKLIFTSALTPQVTWGGALAIDLIHGFAPVAGDAFDLLDFDPARDSGAFATTNVTTSNGSLGPGLAFDLSELYLTGVVRVGAAPEIAGVTANATSSTAIQVDASVDPNGANTVAWIEFGTTLAFGNQTANVSIGNGTSPVPFTANLTGLSANTTYFLRVHAHNAAGATFSTPTLQVATPPDLTRYQQWAQDELNDVDAARLDDHDGDGVTNLEEYALALFPPFPGAFDPTGELHTYGEGERLRVRFWRHIDRDDITLVVQANDALTGNWTDVATSVHGGNFTGPGFVSEDHDHPLDEPGLVEVRDTQNMTAGDRRFLRILIIPDP